MSISRKLISNTVYLFLDWFVLTSIGFLYWLIAAKTLLPYDYGIISTSINLAGVLSGISLLGLGTATAKLIPEYLAKKQLGKVNFIIRFPLKVAILSNLLIVLVFFLFAQNLSTILKVPQEAILITGIFILIFSISGQLGMIIYGFQEMKKFLLTDTVGQIAKVAIATILIFLGFRYLGPLIGILLGLSVIAILRALSIPFKGKVEKVDKREIFLDYALPAFIGTIAWIFFLQGQYVLLTLLQNPEPTGIFTIAMLLAGVIATFPNILNQALFPIISQLSVDHTTKEKQKYLLATVFRYSLFITLPIAVFLTLFSKQVILIFSRPEYLPATTLFPILVSGSLFLAIAQIFNSSLYAIGRTKISRNNAIATTAIFFVFAIPLTTLFSSIGLALSYTISTTIFLFLAFFYLRKFLRIALPIKSMGKLIVATIVAFSFLYVTLELTTGLVLGIILAAIAAAIYLLILLPLKFYTQQDVRLLEFFAEKSPILRAQIKILRDLISNYT